MNFFETCFEIFSGKRYKINALIDTPISEIVDKCAAPGKRDSLDVWVTSVCNSAYVVLLRFYFPGNLILKKGTILHKRLAQINKKNSLEIIKVIVMDHLILFLKEENNCKAFGIVDEKKRETFVWNVFGVFGFNEKDVDFFQKLSFFSDSAEVPTGAYSSAVFGEIYKRGLETNEEPSLHVLPYMHLALRSAYNSVFFDSLRQQGKRND